MNKKIFKIKKNELGKKDYIKRSSQNFFFFHKCENKNKNKTKNNKNFEK